MRKIVFVFIAVLGLTQLAFSQDKACIENTKQGKFSYLMDGEKVLVERIGDKQIETYNEGKIILKVVWTSDYEYDLILVKAKKIKAGKKGDVISVKVIHCEENAFETEVYLGEERITTRFVREEDE